MPLAQLGIRRHHRSKRRRSATSYPHLRGRCHRRRGVSDRMIIDTNVQPHFRYNAEIRRYLPAAHKLRSVPDVEQQWYQAPGGDYREDLYGEHYPGSDPETVARHLFEDARV